MKIDAEKWAEIRKAVELDDVETFQQMIQECARLAVGAERARQRMIDNVKYRERGISFRRLSR